MPSYKIQVITLDQHAESVRELIGNLPTLSVGAEVFNAIDGRKALPSLQDDEILDQTLAIKERFIPLTNTEVACYLSHLRAIKQAYRDGVEKLCLLEDDVAVEDNFAACLNKIFALPDEYQFVRLMGLKRHKYKVLEPIDPQTSLVRPVKGLCGAQGYVINRQGMEIVIQKGSRICEPIDKFYDHYWEWGLKSFAVIPHIIWEKPSSSTIAKESRVKAARGFWLKLRFHYLKIARSFRRHWYILCHWSEFRPTTKPAKYLGRTPRIH
jgi:glycosyl transferase family 25